MHHIDLGLFKYQLEFTQEILKQVGGTELQKVFDKCLRQVFRFPGLKLLSKFGQLKVMTMADHRHIMKIVIFALDDIFEEWNNITYNELCDFYAKFSKMYIMSREESYTENELQVFEVIILVNIQQLKVMFNDPLNIFLTKYLIKLTGSNC